MGGRGPVGGNSACTFLGRETQIQISDIFVENLDTSRSWTAAAFSEQALTPKCRRLLKYCLLGFLAGEGIGILPSVARELSTVLPIENKTQFLFISKTN